MGIEPHQRISLLLFHDFPAGLRHTPLHEVDTMTWPVVPVQRQRQIHTTLGCWQLAVHSGHIGFGYLSLLEKARQAAMGFGVTGQHHQPRGVVVQPVHDAHPGNPLRQPVDQTVLFVFSSSWNAEHTVRLDHHHQVVILV